MKKRSVIEIDRDKCVGCGNCTVNCEQGALQIVDGKAELISEHFCDGLGNCIGDCPTGALEIKEREAKEFKGKDEKADDNHKHSSGCPGSKMMELQKNKTTDQDEDKEIESQLQNWPIQINLLPPKAPYFDDADLLIIADCVAGAYGNFQQDLVSGRVVAMGCPKLDDSASYIDKLAAIFANNDLKSITVARMEVPCCGGLVRIVQQALEQANIDLDFTTKAIGVNGKLKE
ncbi:MAG: ATP-binding protein [Bacillota bacterium]